jgi:hypothetical protein
MVLISFTDRYILQVLKKELFAPAVFVQIQGTLGSEEPSGDGIRVYRNTWKMGGFSGR